MELALSYFGVWRGSIVEGLVFYIWFSLGWGLLRGRRILGFIESKLCCCSVSGFFVGVCKDRAGEGIVIRMGNDF